ncbi:hypothetical protein ACIBL3_46430 [Kribbella sp. NPDC050124]|uniref:hypothetical protein n=1 Tax=Kribbella sp. NPDC050124 TaxID=3364114 RepID=UPI00379A22E1
MAHDHFGWWSRVPFPQRVVRTSTWAGWSTAGFLMQVVSLLLSSKTASHSAACGRLYSGRGRTFVAIAELNGGQGDAFVTDPVTALQLQQSGRGCSCSAASITLLLLVCRCWS